jgi:hypothetical protein
VPTELETLVARAWRRDALSSPVRYNALQTLSSPARIDNRFQRFFVPPASHPYAGQIIHVVRLRETRPNQFESVVTVSANRPRTVIALALHSYRADIAEIGDCFTSISVNPALHLVSGDSVEWRISVTGANAAPRDALQRDIAIREVETS